MLYLYHVNKLKYHEIVDQMIIGRTTGQIICSEDGRMSGKHAQFIIESVDGEPHLYVQDLGSKNCTIVNRAEIPPQQKVRIKIDHFLEVGNQQFLITDSKEVRLNDIAELIKKHISRSILKLDSDKIWSKNMTPPPTHSEMTPLDLLKVKEAQILEMQNEVISIEQTAKADLAKLEEEKEKIVTRLKTRKAEMNKTITTMQLAVDELKEEIAKFRSEVEMKKKKIINLKDLPSDSSEELPE